MAKNYKINFGIVQQESVNGVPDKDHPAKKKKRKPPKRPSPPVLSFDTPTMTGMVSSAAFLGARQIVKQMKKQIRKRI